MINFDNIENSLRHEIADDNGDGSCDLTNTALQELITRLRQAEKLNAELKDRMSHIGMDVGIATTGQVPGDHPIKSRLEMVAKLAKDAARYRWLRDEAHFKRDNSPLAFFTDANGHWMEFDFDGSSYSILYDKVLDAAIDEAMQCK